MRTVYRGLTVGLMVFVLAAGCKPSSPGNGENSATQAPENAAVSVISTSPTYSPFSSPTNGQWSLGSSPTTFPSEAPLESLVDAYVEAKRRLDARFERAIADAKTFDESNVVRNLTAVLRANSNLVWREFKTNSNPYSASQWYVSVVVWTALGNFDSAGNEPIKLDQMVWVTMAPELSVFCRQSGIRDITKMTVRVEQLLGMRAGSGKTRFVELWVSPDHLFRPSADPEINDSVAESGFRRDPWKPLSDHQRWYENLRQISYNPQTGAPWTRLGYTYDWGNPSSKVGLSEFVIRNGASVRVASVKTNDEFFNAAWGTDRRDPYPFPPYNPYRNSNR